MMDNIYKRRPRRVWWMVMACVALLLSIGCCRCGGRVFEDRTNRHAGERGDLLFTYESEWDVRNFNKPLQQGSKIDVGVLAISRDPGSAHVRATCSLHPEHLSVVRIGGDEVRIEALREGRGSVQVSAIDGHGAQREDVITWRVAEPAEVHYFPERSSSLSEEVHYLEFPAGSFVEIPWVRYAHNQEVLVGFGNAPVRITPAYTGKVDRSHRHSDTLKLIMPDVPVIFEVSPAPGVQGDRLVIEVKGRSLWRGLTAWWMGSREHRSVATGRKSTQDLWAGRASCHAR